MSSVSSSVNRTTVAGRIRSGLHAAAAASSNPTRALRPTEFDYWKAQHLLNRAGFGGTPSQARALANMGLEKAIDYIIDYHDIQHDAVRADEFDYNIMRPLNADERRQAQMARRSGDETLLDQIRRRRQEAQRADRRQMGELQRWWLKRMIETPRPLEEKLTLFWHGHFATGYRKIEDSYHLFMQNQLLRVHATGNFAELVRGIIRDPAMLAYLDNNRNNAASPNENLARELMELFTLGEGNDYTEQDIKEAARALTGYTFDDDTFVFRPNQHDNGMKRILGRSGRFDGEDLVNIILSRPVCSEFICWKLYRFFINDEPGDPDSTGQRFIKDLAATFRRSNYELKPVLRTMFQSQHFYDDRNVAAQIKSPVQLVVQAIRSLRTPARDLGALLSASDLMGQNLFFPPSVKGWDGGRAWINTSTMFVRQNTLVYLLTGRKPDAYPWDADGTAYDATHLIEHLTDNGRIPEPREAIVYLLRFNLGREPHPQRVQTLLDFVNNTSGGRMTNAVLIGLLSLITAMPEYQLC